MSWDLPAGWRVCGRAAAGLVLLLLIPWSRLPCAAGEAAKDSPDAQRAQQLAERNQLWDQARALDRHGQVDEALAAAEKTLTLQRTLSGDLSDDVATLLIWIAERHEARQAWDEAQKRREEVLRIYNWLRGESHWQTVEARHWLAHLQACQQLTAAQRERWAAAQRWETEARSRLAQGQFQPAAELFERSLAARRDLFGEQHARYAEQLNRLAICYGRLKQFARAEFLSRRSLQIYEQAFGKDHPLVALLLSNLAYVQSQAGDLDGARANYRRAADIQRAAFGPASSVYRDVLRDLAGVTQQHAAKQEQEEDYAAATAARREVWQWKQQLWGERHWEVTDARLALEHLERLAALDEPARRRAVQADRDWQAAQRLRDEGQRVAALARAEQARMAFAAVWGPESVQCGRAAMLIGDLTFDQQQFETAQKAFEQAIRVFRDVLGDQHPDLALALNNCGAACDRLGDLPAAVDGYRHACQIYERVLDPKHPRRRTSLENLAEACAKLGKQKLEQRAYDDAAGAWEQVVAARIKLHGEPHWKVTDARLEVAGIRQLAGLTAAQQTRLQEADAQDQAVAKQQEDGQFRAAREAMAQQLSARQEILGAEHPRVAETLLALGDLDDLLGDGEAAGRHYQQAVSIREKSLGAEHPATADALHTLGMLLASRGEAEPAKTLLERALAMQTQLLGERDAATAATRQDLERCGQATTEKTTPPLSRARRRMADKALEVCHQATKLVKEGRREEALAAAEKTLALTKAVFGDTSDLAHQQHETLAFAYLEAGRFAESQRCYQDVLESQTKSHAADDWRLAETRARLALATRLTALDEAGRQQWYQTSQWLGRADALETEGQRAEALPLLEQSLETRRKLCPDDPLATADCQNRLAVLRLHGEDYERARQDAAAAVAGYRQTLGAVNRPLADSLKNLGHAWKGLGQAAEARPRFEQALQIYLQTAGPDDADTVDAMYGLGWSGEALGDHVTARRHLEEALRLAERVHGSAHRMCALINQTLGVIAESLGDRVTARQRLEQAVAIYRQVAGDQDLATVTAVQNLGDLLSRSGAHAALQYQQQALALREKILGAEHPLTIASQFTLGCTYLFQNDPDEAEPRLRAVVERLQQLQGVQSADYRAARDILTQVYQSQAQRRLEAADFAAARQALRQALALHAAAPGEAETATAELRELLADVDQLEQATPPQRQRLQEADEQLRQVDALVKQKRYREALPLARQAFETRREILTADRRRTAEAAASLASCHVHAGAPEAAEPLFRLAVETYRKTLGEQHPDYYLSLTMLAQVLLERGQAGTAEPLFEQALAIARKTRGPQDATYQLVAGFLVRLYLQRVDAYEQGGDFSASLQWLETALDLNVQLLGAEHWDVATVRWRCDRARQFAALPDESRQRLAEAGAQLRQAYRLAGGNAEGEALSAAEQALRAYEALLGADHPELIAALEQMARLEKQLGRLEAAQQHLERAVALSRQSVGQVHEQTSRCYNLLGLVLMDRRDYGPARQAFEQALQIDQRMAPESGAVASALNNLAWSLHELGEYTAARSHYERSLAIRRRVYGPDHPRTAVTLSNLGSLLDDMRDAAAARECLDQALAIYRRAYGEQAVETAGPLRALGDWCRAHDRLAEARTYYEQAVAISATAVGADHPQTARYRQDLGSLLTDLEDYAAARAQLEQALAAFRQRAGPDTSDIASCLSSLSKWSRLTGDLAAARTQMEESLALVRKQKGPAHPFLADGLMVLGLVFEDMGDYATARTTYEQALAIQRQVWGPQHHRTATALAKLGQRYQDMGYYSEARQFLEEALKIFRETPGREADIAETLNPLGRLHLDLKDYAEGRRCLEESLTLERKLLGPKHLDLATALHNVGAVLECMGSTAAARLYLEESLAMKTDLFGADDPNLCVTLNALALLVKETDPAVARRYYDQELAIKLRVLQRQSPPTVAALETVADQFKKMDRREEALAHYQRALQTVREKLGAQHPQTAPLLDAMAGCQSGGPAALPYRQQALEVVRQAYGERSAVTARYQKKLAHLLLGLNRVAEAQQQFDRALAVYEQVYGPTHPDTLRMLADVAGALQVKDHDVARPYFDRLLARREATLGPDHPDTADTRLQIADGLIRRQRLEEAWPELIRGVRTVTAERTRYLARSAEDEQRWLGVHRRYLFEAVLSVAEGLPELADDRADQILELLLDWKSGGGQLLRARQEALVCEPDPTAVRLAGELAAARQRLVALQLQGSRAGGDAAYRQQLDTLRRQHDELERQVAERVRDYAVLRQAFQAGPVAVARQLEPDSVLVEFVKYRRWHPDATTADDGWKPPRYAALLLWPQPPQGWSDDFAQAEALSRRSGRPLLILFHAPWAGWAIKLRQEVLARPEVQAAIQQKYIAVQVDHQKHPDLVQRFGVTAVPAVLIVGSDGKVLSQQAGLLGKEAFLEWLGKAPGGAPRPRFVPLGDAQPIEAAIRDWRRAVQAGTVPADVDRRLREAVWQPLAHVLPADVRRLYIAPDGELGLLPLEAVRLDDGRYLVEQYAVSYLANGRDRMSRLKRPGGRGPAVVVSNPDYDAGSATVPPPVAPGLAPPPGTLAMQPRSTDAALRDFRFATLPGFTGEAAAVVQTWRAQRPSEPLEEIHGSQASEERLAALPHPRVLHLITHGFFLPDLSPRGAAPLGSAPDNQPSAETATPEGRGLTPLAADDEVRPRLPGEDPRLRSGVALAGANRWEQRIAHGQSDGLLTALDVQNLDLWGTELVVLSACETALGEVQVGEGVLGLRRAFQLAGAETVIASLWKVPDAETQQLMARFFALWLGGQPKAAALRTAQLELIQQLRQAGGPRRDAPPLYWAGFICHGQPL